MAQATPPSMDFAHARFPFLRSLQHVTPEIFATISAVVIPHADCARALFSAARFCHEVRGTQLAAGLQKEALDQMLRGTGYMARIAGHRDVLRPRGGPTPRKLIPGPPGVPSANTRATVRRMPGKVGFLFAVESGGLVTLMHRSEPLRFADIGDGDHLTLIDQPESAWFNLVGANLAKIAPADSVQAILKATFASLPKARVTYNPENEHFTLTADVRLKSPNLLATVHEIFEFGSATFHTEFLEAAGPDLLEVKEVSTYDLA